MARNAMRNNLGNPPTRNQNTNQRRSSSIMTTLLKRLKKGRKDPAVFVVVKDI